MKTNTPYRKKTSQKELVKAGRTHLLYYNVAHTAATNAWLQVFDVADAGDITLGSTPPVHSFPIEASSGGSIYAATWDQFPGPKKSQDGLMVFENGLAFAVTTTDTGATLVTDAVVNLRVI